MADECRRTVFGFKKCRFEPRYDVGPARALNAATLDALFPVGEDIVAALKASRQKTYVQDVCIACGKIVKR